MKSYQHRGLSYNLLSVRKFEMNGFAVFFEDVKGITKKEDSVAAITYRRNNLYLY